MKTVMKTKKIIKGNEDGSALPYVLGWFMGVPTSVLLLIFLLRSC
jgi:hypothetical protein